MTALMTPPATSNTPAVPDRIHINEVCKHFPAPSGKPRHIATVARWITGGVRLNGQTVKLWAVRVGGAWYTNWTAVNQFEVDLTRARLGEPIEPPTDGGRRQAAVESQLDAEGL